MVFHGQVILMKARTWGASVLALIAGFAIGFLVGPGLDQYLQRRAWWQDLHSHTMSYARARHASIMLGKTADVHTLDQLGAILNDPNEAIEIRRLAANGLGHSLDNRGLKHVLKTLDEDQPLLFEARVSAFAMITGYDFGLLGRPIPNNRSDQLAELRRKQESVLNLPESSGKQ